MFSNRTRLVACACLLAWTAILFHLQPQAHANSDTLTVSVLNIGQGDAIFIEAPNDHQIIVDGGPENNLIGELAEVMPFGDTSIDAIIVTNPDTDHFNGFIGLLDKYSVDMALVPGTLATTGTWKKLTDKLDEKKVPTYLARTGMKLVLDEDKNIAFEILFPDSDVTNWAHNDASIVGAITYGKTAVFLTGDGTIKTEGIILQRVQDYADFDTLLKVGHHGSKTSTGDAFLKALSPEIAAISAGVHNRYGHPNKETIDRLDRFHIPYLLTARDGRITCTSDAVVWNCMH